MELIYGNPVLTAAAVIPVIILLVQIYRADHVEKEPMGLLISLVLYGILATFFAVLTEQLGHVLVSAVFWEGSFLYNLLFYFCVVAASEEGFKYILLKRRTWNSLHFNYQFDGIVYAVFVSLGFAMWENISYVAMYGLQVAMLRAVTAIPGHACFGVFMGAWYGVAKKFDRLGNREKAARYRKLAFWMPMLLHGAYDFLASMEADWSGMLFLLYLAGMFLTSFYLVRRQSRNDRYMQGLSVTHMYHKWPM